MDTQDNSAPFDVVAGDPAAFFETPQAVVDDASLSRAEKLQLLDEWAQDLADRSNAADEGMVPDRAGPIDRDVRTAAAVVAARTAVEAGEDAFTPSLALRLWKRLTGATA
ncbi:hypothetical protein EUV02_11945 [Polymorphobacter arshaanensis]|uniref:Uncharacterized protein n=1 Tax=Glacieibacterium arshaanense TaxID=2511025 RepID=A0A4Y9EJU5_9SPHN|nr:hypothetical protein [Polymorphobacter arshaanensis]TFU01024.1 hypothetical protein EUV02_11945 [Polymorphobacter arshaanensis]